MSMVRMLSLYDVLWNVADLIRPKSYLEIGFREGASLMSAITQEREIVRFIEEVNLDDARVNLTPQILKQIGQRFTLRPELKELYLFDNLEQLTHREGVEHIESLVRDSFKYRGDLCFGIGDSRTQLPRCLESFPELMVDLALVDGGHELEVVTEDLENLAGHFKVLLCHDINHWFWHRRRRTQSPEYSHMKEAVEKYAYQHGYAITLVGQRRFGTAVLFNWRGCQS